jgi:hypothetical protein
MLWSLLPSSAKSSIEVDQTLVLGAARSSDCQLGCKQRTLPIENFKISSCTSRVAHDRQTDRFPQVRDRILLANTNLMVLLVGDQSVGHITKGTLNGLSVGYQRLPML